LLLSLAVSCQLGCEHLGPRTIVDDRDPYSNAVATSWQEQTLLSIVRLRYGDTPFFVDVAQIVSGYSLGETCSPALGVAAALSRAAPFTDRLFGNVAYQSAFIDRPTISHAPQTSPQFIRNLALPLPPGGVLYLMQAGYPLNLVFDLMLDSINGIQGRTLTSSEVRPASPEYHRVVELLREAQLSGHVGMHVEVGKDKLAALVMTFRDEDIDPELPAKLDEVRRLLRMDRGARQVRVVFGTARGGSGEITMHTRSIFRVLTLLSTSVQVPECHLAQGRAPVLDGDLVGDPPRFTVHSGCEPPKNCFAAVPYRGCWFWISDCDFASKRTMAYLMVLLALADTGAKETVPFLTIQAD
jgi:hypothetical protein